ncbi:MAG: zf-HC2 domain-containing protein [Aeromicrobium sp.]
MTARHDELRESLGAYVLGQLDDAERQEVEEHLRTCAECRAERDEVAPVAEALRAFAPTLRNEPAPTPPELDARVRAMLPAETSPWRRRWMPAAAGLAVGIAASTIVAFSLPQDEAPIVPTVVAIDGVRSAQGVKASAGLVDHSWGVEIKITADGLKAGRIYDVWVVGLDGKPYSAGEIVGVADTTIHCNMSSAIPLDSAKSFRVEDPSGNAVISADLVG